MRAALLLLLAVSAQDPAPGNPLVPKYPFKAATLVVWDDLEYRADEVAVRIVKASEDGIEAVVAGAWTALEGKRSRKAQVPEFRVKAPILR